MTAAAASQVKERTKKGTHRPQPDPDAAQILFRFPAPGDAPLLAQQDGDGHEQGEEHGQRALQRAARPGPAVRPHQGADGGGLRWCVGGGGG